MGTNYYHLKAPITNVKPELLGDHVHVGIWVRRGKAGELVMSEEEWSEFLRAITDIDRFAIHTRWGGERVGTVISEHEANLDCYTQLVSDCGELRTVQEIRCKRGAKREGGQNETV